jgi:hypothetical protein
LDRSCIRLSLAPALDRARRPEQGPEPASATSDEDRELATAHPIRQRDLGRDVEAGQNSDPAGSSHEASAPAGSANRNNGKVVATSTIETMNGSGSRSVISQKAKVECKMFSPGSRKLTQITISGFVLFDVGTNDLAGVYLPVLLVQQDDIFIFLCRVGCG